jgi:hypothetical protein
MEKIFREQKLQELEKYAKFTLGIDVEKLYEDLEECYQEEGEVFDEKQKLFCMFCIGNYSRQEVADFCGFKNAKSVTEDASKKLFKYFYMILEVDRIRWDCVQRTILDNKKYVSSTSLDRLRRIEATLTMSRESFDKIKEDIREVLPNFKIEIID